MPCIATGQLVENDKTIQCEHAYPERKCDFTLWKESTKKYFGVDLDMNLVEKLTSGETIELTRKSKEGKEYTAKYDISKNDKGYWGLNFKEFVSK